MRSCELWGLRSVSTHISLRRRFTVAHKSSMGLRSGELGGQESKRCLCSFVISGPLCQLATSANNIRRSWEAPNGPRVKMVHEVPRRTAAHYGQRPIPRSCQDFPDVMRVSGRPRGSRIGQETGWGWGRGAVGSRRLRCTETILLPVSELLVVMCMTMRRLVADTCVFP